MRKEKSKRKTGMSLQAGPLRPAIYIAEKGKKRVYRPGRAGDFGFSHCVGFLQVLYNCIDCSIETKLDGDFF